MPQLNTRAIQMKKSAKKSNNDPRQYAKTGYVTQRSRMNKKDTSLMQKATEFSTEFTRPLVPRPHLLPLAPPKTAENGKQPSTLGSPRSRDNQSRQRPQAFAQTVRQRDFGSREDSRSVYDNSKIFGTSVFSSKRQTLQGLSTSAENEASYSLKVTRAKILPEKQEEQELMAYISNQRAVLPALRDIIDKQIEDLQPAGEGLEGDTSLSDQKQNKSMFQYDLLLDRMQRDRNIDSKVAGGLSDLSQNPLNIQEPGENSKGDYVSTMSATKANYRNNQKLNTNSLMLGVGVQYKTKQQQERNLMSKRKASVPLSQTTKINMFKAK